MSVIKKLVVDGRETVLKADADLDELRQRMEGAFTGNRSRWVEVPGKDATEYIFMTEGLDIRVFEFVRRPARVTQGTIL